MRLEEHEKLLIARRRRGANQREMAKYMAVPMKRYVLWEEGKIPVPPEARLKTGRLERHEELTLMRRRAGKTQADVAKGLKCSRRWVMLMETGRAPVDDLAWYWEQ